MILVNRKNHNNTNINNDNLTFFLISSLSFITVIFILPSSSFFVFLSLLYILSGREDLPRICEVECEKRTFLGATSRPAHWTRDLISSGDSRRSPEDGTRNREGGEGKRGDGNSRGEMHGNPQS